MELNDCDPSREPDHHIPRCAQGRGSSAKISPCFTCFWWKLRSRRPCNERLNTLWVCWPGSRRTEHFMWSSALQHAHLLSAFAFISARPKGYVGKCNGVGPLALDPCNLKHERPPERLIQQFHWEAGGTDTSRETRVNTPAKQIVFGSPCQLWRALCFCCLQVC